MNINKALKKKTFFMVVLAITLWRTPLVYGYSRDVENFDKATGVERMKVEEKLLRQGVVDGKEFRAYANDRTKPGGKRFRALVLSLQGSSSPEQHKQILQMYRKEKDHEFLYGATSHMADWNDSETVTLLKRIVNDSKSDPCLSLIAGSSLAHQKIADGKAQSVKAILEQRMCRDFAMQTLANLDAVDVILQLESDPRALADPVVRDDCQLAIFRIRLHGKSIPDQQKMLEDALMHPYSGGVTRWGTLYLVNIGDQTSFEILVRIANNKQDASMRDVSIRALQWGAERGRWSAEAVRARIEP